MLSGGRVETRGVEDQVGGVKKPHEREKMGECDLVCPEEKSGQSC